MYVNNLERFLGDVKIYVDKFEITLDNVAIYIDMIHTKS